MNLSRRYSQTLMNFLNPTLREPLSYPWCAFVFNFFYHKGAQSTHEGLKEKSFLNG